MTEVTVADVAVAETTVIEPLVTELMAVRDEGVIVVEGSPAIPVIAPVAPAPPKSSKEADTKSKTKGKANAAPKKAGAGIPPRGGGDRCTVHQPRIIGRDAD